MVDPFSESRKLLKVQAYNVGIHVNVPENIYK